LAYGKNLTKKYTVHGLKIAKMIGVKLRCKLIPWAMLVGLGSVSRAPTREVIMPRALSPWGMVSEKGVSFSLHNISGGLI